MLSATYLGCAVFCMFLVRDLHRFFIAAVRAAVNEDDLGGTAFGPACMACWVCV